MAAVVETSTAAERVCRQVCCCEFPVQIATEAIPKLARRGAALSSIQVTVCGVPAAQLVEAIGAVTKTVANADEARPRAMRVDENIIVY